MYNAGDFALGATVYLPFNTAAADGSSITIATNGTLKVYKLSSNVERTSASGITFTEDFDSITGRHLVSIDTSDDTDSGFYIEGEDYGVARDAMTIDGVTVNSWLAMFSLGNRSAIMPVTAGNKIRTSGSGNVGIDLANVENAGNTLALSGTTVGAVADRTNYELSNTGIDAILSRPVTEPAGPFGWATATVGQILAWLGKLGKDKITQTATTQSLYNEAGTTVISTSTVSDDGTTATRGTFV